MELHQLWLEVIGSNVANVNTPGFKKSALRQESLGVATISPATEPYKGLGGVNPVQVGEGVSLANIPVIHTQGIGVTTTDVPTNMAISGRGYFILRDPLTDTPLYTRVGNFEFDNVGNLVNLSNGFRVQGWNAERDEKGFLITENGKTKINTALPLQDIVIPQNDVLNANPTSRLTFAGTLNPTQKLPLEPINLLFTKNITSAVALEEVDITKPWADAGFAYPPSGVIQIDKATFSLAEYATPAALMDVVNASAPANVKMEFNKDNRRFIISPKEGRTAPITLSEIPGDTRYGFFTAARILPGTYESTVNLEVEFQHLLEPNNPNRNYYRWKAVDPTSGEVRTTNAYFFVSDDEGIPAEAVSNELVGIGNSLQYVFELRYPDVDPDSLQVFIDGVAQKPTKLPLSDWITVVSNIPLTGYYFDDNGETEWLWNARAQSWEYIGKSEYGRDRIIFIDTVWDPTAQTYFHNSFAPPAAGAKITANYSRVGFNLSSASVDEATLKLKIDGTPIENKGLYRFNNNLGVGGSDQIAWFSTASKEVVQNALDVTKPMSLAGFNSPTGPLEDIKWKSSFGINFETTAGRVTWTSNALNSYSTLQAFITSVNEGVKNKAIAMAGTAEIKFELSYDHNTDKFYLKSNKTVTLFTTTGGTGEEHGFLMLSKLVTPYAVIGVSTVTVSANENPSSYEEVVKNELDIKKEVNKAGFNNFSPMGSIIFSWFDVGIGSWVVWTSDAIETYETLEKFIYHVNHAFVMVGAEKVYLPVTLRYDPIKDVFTLQNTNPTLRVSQSIAERGFLTVAKLLGKDLAPDTSPVNVPISPVPSGGKVTADYFYNKTIEARGILELDKENKVIENYMDTEKAPMIESYEEVIGGPGKVMLSGGWGQFESGTVDGTITIKTRSGTYTSREINSSNYPTVEHLINEINASVAKVLFTYDPATDKFKLQSRLESDIIILEETGTIPFFSEINFVTGEVKGGNNNLLLDLDTEIPTANTTWRDTTGLKGMGHDFFRVNIMPNEIKGERLGILGSFSKEAELGTEVYHLPVNEYLDSETWAHMGVRVGLTFITFVFIEKYVTGNPASEGPPTELPYGRVYNDVDPDSIRLYRFDGTRWFQIPPDDITIYFYDNAGPLSADMIQVSLITSGAIAEGEFIFADFTRKNAFDLKRADIDPTTLVVRVNGIIQEENKDYKFEDNGGANGVDRIVFLKSYDPGEVVIDYRLVSPAAVDVLVPNGNFGPESITFTPNKGVVGVYPSGEIPNLADTGEKVTAPFSREEEYLYTTAEKLYDALGQAWEAQFKFERLTSQRWLWLLYNPVEKDKLAGYGVIYFDSTGIYDEENSLIGESPSDPATLGTRFKGIYFTPPATQENGVLGTPVKISLDLSKIRHYEYEVNSAEVESQDGYPYGKFIRRGITITSEGVIIASYDNEQSREVARVALATFNNPEGLAAAGGTVFTETKNSGTPQIGTPGTGGRGTIEGRTLENSNVDLTQEMVNMIIAQRAFQANSRTIITADVILGEIIGIRR
jgi:flagellar hook-basal body protein